MRTFPRVKEVYILLLVVLFVLFQFKITIAAPPISEGKLKGIIEEAMNKEQESQIIPMGLIWINGPILGNTDINPAKRSYGNGLLKFMEAYQKLGIINMKKEQTMDYSRTKYIVSIAQNGEKETAKKLDNGDYLLKSWGKVKINKIVKSTEYKLETMPNDEYRLVLYTCNYYPTDLGKKILFSVSGRVPDQYKEKVLLKYDPFSDKYKYIIRD